MDVNSDVQIIQNWRDTADSIPPVYYNHTKHKDWDRTDSIPSFYYDCVKHEGPDTADSIPEIKEDSNVIKKD